MKVPTLPLRTHHTSKTGADARAKRSPAPAWAPGHQQPDTPAAEVAVKFRAGVLENFSQKESRRKPTWEGFPLPSQPPVLLPGPSRQSGAWRAEFSSWETPQGAF